MSRYLIALAWAAVILAVALAGRLGLGDPDVIATLTIVLPAIAFITLLSGGACGRARRA